ncbi:GNAT family N-acetyltransferase [Hazenella sp. IB182357]|uniref:GNAT family N-acetyltransferase n=1 Tax=Polycladospora coralii TaxID=2771432 RepID=A0A926NC90_9BACL|nr:GNAT family N-acetyltransferase [Polycladospora coralii]MBD1373602.1 GNAT family N-acetyltransferase [Polycladospora coralii]
MKIYQTEDVALIAKLNEHVHRLHEIWYPSLFKSYNFTEIKREFEKIIKRPQFCFFMIEDKQVPLGYAWIEKREYVTSAFRQFTKSIYIHQLCVIPEARGQGFGKALMFEIERLAMREGYAQLELDYWVKNQAASDFYSSIGYRVQRQQIVKEMPAFAI